MRLYNNAELRVLLKIHATISPSLAAIYCMVCI